MLICNHQSTDVFQEFYNETDVYKQVEVLWKWIYPAWNLSNSPNSIQSLSFNREDNSCYVLNIRWQQDSWVSGPLDPGQICFVHFEWSEVKFQCHFPCKPIFKVFVMELRPTQPRSNLFRINFPLFLSCNSWVQAHLTQVKVVWDFKAVCGHFGDISLSK